MPECDSQRVRRSQQLGFMNAVTRRPGPTTESHLDAVENIEIDHDLNLEDVHFLVQWLCRPATATHHDSPRERE
jgi:hypothetical protein